MTVDLPIRPVDEHRSKPPAEFLAGADHLHIAADHFGSSEGMPVIFLHGGGQSRSAWRCAAEGVASAGLYGISLDLRGHGESDWASDGDYSLERHVADLTAIIETLGKPAVLVGASLGGNVSLMAASKRPDLVRALALADVTPWLNEERAHAIRIAMRNSAGGFESIETAAAMVAALRGEEVRSDKEGLRRHMREASNGRLHWRWDPRFIADQFVGHNGDDGMIARAASKLRLPTLLMHAENSNLVSQAHVSRFRQAVPHLDYELVHGVGHMVTADDNDAYLRPLMRFLRKLKFVPEN